MSQEKTLPEPSAPPYPSGATSSIPGVAVGEDPPSYEATTSAPTSLPPTYQSLYGEFRRVDDPRSLAQFLGKAFTALINTVTAAVTIAFLNIIPLFMIVLGAVNLGNCQIEPRIPIWLIVSGSAHLLRSAINFCHLKDYSGHLHRQDSPEQNIQRWYRNLFKLLLSFLAIFSVIWFVTGTVWVYRVYSDVNYEDEQGSDHCDRLTYFFSFVYATLGYASCMLLLICCFCCCCLCCCACLGGKAGSRYEAVPAV